MSTPLEQDLRRQIEGAVRFDTSAKTVYSVDASIYEIEPIGVVVPRNLEDLHKAIQIAAVHKAPIIARGAATGIAGGCIGRGLILDTAQHLNRILEINYGEEYAICEPGVVQDQLNEALSDRGYRLGPDTSTGNRATLGGMLGNNAAGARSLRYGKVVDHVIELDLLLGNGEKILVKALSKNELDQRCQQEDREGAIYREVLRIQANYKEDIKKHFPKLPRRVSGYNLDELVKDQPLNLCKLIVGAEGTLGVAGKIKVRISRKPQVSGLCILHFENMIQALEQVSWLLESSPLSLELIDQEIIRMGRMSPSMRDKMDWLQGEPAALLVVEFDAFRREEVKDRCIDLMKKMKDKGSCYASSRILDPKEMQNVWALRKAGLGLLLSRRTYSRAIGFLEDVSVSPQKIAPFMERFLAYLESCGKKAGVYGHVGAGCVHVRPFIDLRKKDDVELMEKMMIDVADLLLEFGGSLSGEHGDGLVRSWLNRKMFGERLYQAFCEIKHAFDPEGQMNPGKIVEAPKLLTDLRMTPQTEQLKIETQYDFSREGGFDLAVDMCNGNAACRKREGLMCPSFQAYGNELHSTRARAQSLRSIINKQQAVSAFTSQGLHDILDYCLECKGCKTQCPSQVDMAKIKAEFLYHYQKEHGYSWRSQLFAHTPDLLHYASYIPRLANLISGTSLQGRLFQALGISTERAMPPHATRRFSRWLQKQKVRGPSTKRVVLFNDTYTEFNYPEIGIAAHHVLTSLGYQVIVPKWQCCGRPLISKGFLPEAKRKAQALVDLLYPYAKLGIPIVGLEPSCILTIKDDYRDLLSGNQRQSVVDSAVTLDEFLARELDAGRLALSLHQKDLNILVHGHCHQKALVGMEPTLNVLRTLPGIHAEEIPSGCCGLAGSFGYEKEHYDMSLAIAENTLAPAVRNAPSNTLIVASGLSCRSQIAHCTGRSSLHLAELLARCIRN